MDLRIEVQGSLLTAAPGGSGAPRRAALSAARSTARASAACESTRLRYRREGRSRRRGIPRVAQRAGAPARRAGAPLRRAGARAQGAARTAGLDRGRQDPAGGPGRSAGSDRHLRLRRRAVAPAAWPDHRQRAAGTSHDGDLAPARAGGRDQRVQLPGRGVGLERGARAGVRRYGAVETVREDAAHRARHARAAGACCATQWAMCPRTSISS